MDKNFLADKNSYWKVAETIKDVYMSDGSMKSLLDFERVLDEIDIYAFKNWEEGELVSGPEVTRYKVTCVFMWPAKLMPDPKGAKRLLPFDCDVEFMKTRIQVPAKVNDYDDFKPGTKKPKLVEAPVWLVEITMPKELMTDIRQGSIELEGQDIDLSELDHAYEQDLDQADVDQEENLEDTTIAGEEGEVPDEEFGL
jgi:hypothetical protein